MVPLEQLRHLAERYEALNAQLGDPEVSSDPERLRAIGQEQAALEPIVAAYREYASLIDQLAQAQAMVDGDDAEMAELAAEELPGLEERRAALEDVLMELLLPRDPNDDRNVIVEIRAGTGGDEAALFAADLFRIYQRFAETQRWKVDIISASEIGIGGLKEVIFSVHGQRAYAKLKWESGVHRVQRVPETEAQGRIHTSTATVAVLPEMDEIEIEVPESDIRVDVFRSSGPGGQSVNTTDSAVRLTHLPTGIVISCQDEKSQLQNRKKALQVLRARLFQVEEDKRTAERGAERRTMVGGAERSEKIRTYNYPQSRVTDHRIGLTSHRLPEIMAGDISDFIEALAAADRAQRLDDARAATAA
ncbi:MAG: peptide chain release factor 1 [Ardenticatenales bacterium]